MRIRYTLPALSDLEQIISYIARHSPQGARHVSRQILASEKRIQQFPLSGSPTRRPNIRRTKVSRFPYLIFYQPTDTEIIIHAVRHTARDPATMPGTE